MSEELKPVNESKRTTAAGVVVLNFAEAPQPVYREVRGGAYMKFGADNLYPLYMLMLYDKATKHGAIVSSKAVYVAGNGWKIKDGQDNPAASNFIDKVNRYCESLADVTRKAALDLEIFAGAYLQVIWNNAGTAIAEVYHLDFTRMRSNRAGTQFYYNEAWGAGYSGTIRSNQAAQKTYPAFNPAVPRGSQILFVKEYRPGQNTYPMPGYMRAVNYISAEIEVGKHTLGNSQTGFSPSKSITMVNGEPEDDEKKKLTRRFERAYTGANGRKFLLFFVNNAEQKPIIESLGESDLSKEDFTAVDTLIQGNIYNGHQITTPALFGISTPGALGQRTELRDGYEIFKKTYVNDKQRLIEGAINRLAAAAGVSAHLEIIPTEPIDIEISADAAVGVMSRNEIRARAGLPPVDGGDAMPATSGQPAGDTTEAKMEGTNDAVRNLTAKQHQQLMRIIRQYSKGELTKEAATALLRTSLGLSDADIAAVLGINDTIAMSDDEPGNDDDFAISVFAEYGADPAGFTVLKSKKVKYSDDADAELREHAYLGFASGQLSELESSILDLINKDKRITPEVIADTLNADLADVNSALKSLEAAGAINVSGKEGSEVRKLNKPLKDLQDGVKAKTKSFKVMYSYDGPQDDRNRPFCAKLMELGRYYTRGEIEAISARLGYSAWDRRGGFYHNRATGETTPYCRHTWVSHVVMQSK